MTGAPMRRRGLGRGLDALLGGLDEPGAATPLIEIDPAEVSPNPEQPRRHLDPEALAALAESIRLHGLLHPIVVERLTDGGHRLIAGERRLRAARMAGVRPIPALVRPATESARQGLELALTENLMRADLSPIEEATAFSRLADTFGLSHEAIAARVGRSRPAVSNSIRLLALPASVQTALAGERLSVGHARALLALPGDEEREEMARRIEAEAMSVRETEQVTQARLQRTPSTSSRRRRAGSTLSPDGEALRQGFEAVLGYPVRITRGGRGGRLVVDVGSLDDLHELYRRLGGPPL